MLKRYPSLTEQVKIHLKQRIINAEFEGRMPSETDLAHELHVSRNTVRDALSRLEMEGVIFRKQGAGTFVNETTLLVKTRLEEILPYETLIQEHGYTPSIHLVSVDDPITDANIAADLLLKPNEPLLMIQKLFFADKQPVILNTTYIPIILIQQPYIAADLQAPIYEFLPRFCQQMLAYYLSDIVPLVATPSLTARLNLPDKKMALLSLEEIGHNQDKMPIIKAKSYFRDDLLRLRLIRRQSIN